MRIDLSDPASGWLIVEPLPDEATSAASVSEADRLKAATFTSPSRRREYLGWRALLYRELGSQTIGYAPSGAPELSHGAGFIGVSHSRAQMALRWSPSHRVAVDIEAQGRNFGPVLSRYLSPEEQRLSPHQAWPCIAWCAKETLYKLADRRELELLRDLRLDAPHFENEESGWLKGLLLGKSYILHFARIGCDWAVWSE